MTDKVVALSGVINMFEEKQKRASIFSLEQASADVAAYEGIVNKSILVSQVTEYLRNKNYIQHWQDSMWNCCRNYWRGNEMDNERMMFIQDDDCHWYLIPTSTYPIFRQLECDHPTSYTFENVRSLYEH